VDETSKIVREERVASEPDALLQVRSVHVAIGIDRGQSVPAASAMIRSR
jgi:hypothetical protein